MTCIVAYVDTDRCVWMGGDGAGIDGYSYLPVSNKKVFSKRFQREVEDNTGRGALVQRRDLDLLIGYTSSFRMGQILQYHLEVPLWANGVALEKWIVVDLVEAVRKVLKEHGYSSVNNNEEHGGCFLLGVNGTIWRVEDAFHAIQVDCGYDAVGCGENFARGALWAAKTWFGAEDRNTNKPVGEWMVKMALGAAAANSAGVDARQHIMTLGPPVD